MPNSAAILSQVLSHYKISPHQFCLHFCVSFSAIIYWVLSVKSLVSSWNSRPTGVSRGEKSKVTEKKSPQRFTKVIAEGLGKRKKKFWLKISKQKKNRKNYGKCSTTNGKWLPIRTGHRRGKLLDRLCRTGSGDEKGICKFVVKKNCNFYFCEWNFFLRTQVHGKIEFAVPFVELFFVLLLKFVLIEKYC